MPPWTFQHPPNNNTSKSLCRHRTLTLTHKHPRYDPIQIMFIQRIRGKEEIFLLVECDIGFDRSGYDECCGYVEGAKFHWECFCYGVESCFWGWVDSGEGCWTGRCYWGYYYWSEHDGRTIRQRRIRLLLCCLVGELPCEERLFVWVWGERGRLRRMFV